jgi:hypothetical protein
MIRTKITRIMNQMEYTPCGRIYICGTEQKKGTVHSGTSLEVPRVIIKAQYYI